MTLGRVTPPTLDRTRALMGAMGDPQQAFGVVHITGTNGKGSTAAMVTALLAARGLSVGTYTSPNLHRVNERLAINGEPIADDALAEALEAVAGIEALVGVAAHRFEVLTAAAYRWFADSAVDVAVVEVGLGGRWDATNVADGAVAVVTNVSADHLEILGPTPLDVAAEKAGIVKPGCRLVVGETDLALASPFLEQAAEVGAETVWMRGVDFGADDNRVAHGGRMAHLWTPASRYEDVFLPAYGGHQADNAAVALAASEAFVSTPLEDRLLRQCFATLALPGGRLEVVGRQPLVLLDGAHNVAGMQALAAALADDFGSINERVVVVGLLAGRDPEAMLAPLAGSATRLVVACPPPSPRAMPAAAVAAAARRLGMVGEEAADLPAALARAAATARPTDLVLVTGSLHLVGPARAHLLSQ